MANNYTIENLDRNHKANEEYIRNFINEVFSRFQNHNSSTERAIKKDKDVFLSSLGILNSFDHYAQFYKGVVPNESAREKVKCPNSKSNCHVCFGGVRYKCRAGGKRKMKDKWHYSKNKKWEMVKVGESYKNFLKNTGIDSGKQKIIYELRNEIDHQGLLSAGKIKIQNNKLFYESVDLTKLLNDSLEKFENALIKELDVKKFRVDKSPRVIRFLDHLYFLRQ